MAADHRQAIIIVHIQLQIFLIDLRNLFHRHHPPAVDDGHVKRVFQILIDRRRSNLRAESGDGAFQKIVVVQNQRHPVQIVDSLDIVELRPRREPGFGRDPLVGGQLHEAQHPRLALFFVADGRFLEGFDAADGIGSLFHGKINIADTFSLHGLHIAVGDQAADGAPQGVSGAAVHADQRVLGGKKLAVGVFAFLQPAL